MAAGVWQQGVWQRRGVTAGGVAAGGVAAGCTVAVSAAESTGMNKGDSSCFLLIKLVIPIYPSIETFLLPPSWCCLGCRIDFCYSCRQRTPPQIPCMVCVVHSESVYTWLLLPWLHISLCVTPQGSTWARVRQDWSILNSWLPGQHTSSLHVG